VSRSLRKATAPPIAITVNRRADNATSGTPASAAMANNSPLIPSSIAAATTASTVPMLLSSSTSSRPSAVTSRSGAPQVYEYQAYRRFASPLVTKNNTR